MFFVFTFQLLTTATEVVCAPSSLFSSGLPLMPPSSSVGRYLSLTLRFECSRKSPCNCLRMSSSSIFFAAASNWQWDSADQVLLKRSQASRIVDTSSAHCEGVWCHSVCGWRPRLWKGRTHDTLW